jgi:hypothetical protein
MKGSHYFGYSFTIYAGIYIGEWASFDESKVYSKTKLFTKPGSAKTWSASAYRASNIIISAPNPGNDPVHLVIYNYSKCSCNQQYKNRPVFWADMDPYIPDMNPYIWQMQEENGTKAWKLVRPLYIVKKHTDNKKYWFNVEDLTTPAYSIDGDGSYEEYQGDETIVHDTVDIPQGNPNEYDPGDD